MCSRGRPGARSSKTRIGKRVHCESCHVRGKLCCCGAPQNCVRSRRNFTPRATSCPTATKPPVSIVVSRRFSSLARLWQRGEFALRIMHCEQQRSQGPQPGSEPSKSTKQSHAGSATDGTRSVGATSRVLLTGQCCARLPSGESAGRQITNGHCMRPSMLAESDRSQQEALPSPGGRSYGSQHTTSACSSAHLHKVSTSLREVGGGKGRR